MAVLFHAAAIRRAPNVSLVTVTALSVALGSTPSPDSAVAETLRLERQNERLKRQLELASSEGLYLLLDVERRALRLFDGGALLRQYSVTAIETGRPEVFFVDRELPADWQTRIWSQGQIVPRPEWRRLVIEAPTSPLEEAEIEARIPPPKEEVFPAPPSFAIRYDGGLLLEIVPRQGAAGQGNARKRLANVAGALGLGTHDALRLRLSLDAADVGALYRSLPPDTRFSLLADDPAP